MWKAQKTPVILFLIDVGLRLGVDRFYRYFQDFGLMRETGIDLPGEASTIMHQKENIGQVELATMSFGQSFQITPIQLAVTVSSIINGGVRITPHFGVEVRDDEGQLIDTLEYESKEGIVSEETSRTMNTILEKVVSEGSGKNAYIEGYDIGGKTATSQTLPRSANRYISSFLGFAPAKDPQVLGICIIYDPQGVYYGGTIAAPVMQRVFENVLPYLKIDLKIEKQKRLIINRKSYILGKYQRIKMRWIMDFKVVIPVIISFAISVALAPFIIPFLRRLKVGQTERVDGVQSHLKKAGTPTMGGLIFLIATAVTSLFYVKDYPNVIPILFLTLGFG